MNHLKHARCAYLLFLISFCLCFPSARASAAVDEQTWAQIRSLRGIATQPAGSRPAVFVFFDPNCPYCARLWESSVGSQAFGAIPAVWIPVSYLGDTALGRAAFLLRANCPEELSRNFTGFSYATRQGGAPGVTPSESERLSLGKSKAVWLKLGGATPLVVYRSRSGEVHKLLGLPADPAKLADVVEQFAPRGLSSYPAR